LSMCVVPEKTVISLSPCHWKDVAMGYIASVISAYVFVREPPWASIAAVNEATPSLPLGSKAEPVMKRTRNETSGERLGSNTVFVSAMSIKGIELWRRAAVGLDSTI